MAADSENVPGLNQRYQNFVNEIIMYRLRIMMVTGSFLYLIFSFLDRFVYPDKTASFLRIRILVSVAMWGVFVLSFLKFLRPIAIHLTVGILYICALGLCAMIYLTEGFTSGYREGITLVFFALLFINGYKLFYTYGLCAAITITYFFLCNLQNPAWRWPDLLISSYFSGSVIFFVLIMTHIYSRQNFRHFVIAERIRDQEKKLETVYQQAKAEAEKDPLTEVFNRRAFFDILDKKIQICDTTGKSFYLLFFDIDNLKHINDRHGHIVGDEAIKLVVNTVRRCLRSGTEMGRFGGDEFMFIIDDAEPAEFLARAEAISRAVLRTSFQKDGQPIAVSASFGAARYYPHRTANLQELLDLADHAVLYSKKNKKGGVHFEG